MLQFLDGSLILVDSKSVLPGYAEAQDISTFLEGAGFEGNNVFGGVDTGFTVEMWRTEYRPEGEAQPSLFIIELCGRVLDEIYCADSAQSLKCLIQLAPLFSAAMFRGFLAHLEEAADARDGIIAGKYRQKVSEVSDIAGLFLAMAGVDKK